MLICKNKKDYLKAKRLRWFGIDRDRKAQYGWQAWNSRGVTSPQNEVGFKYQPTDIDAAIGLAALKTFDITQEHRHKLSNLYRMCLSDIKEVELLQKSDSADWLFMIKIKDRNKLAKYLFDNNIETNVSHIRNDIFKVFGGHRLDLPNLNLVEKQYLCLPINNHINEIDVLHICNIIADFYKEIK